MVKYRDYGVANIVLTIQMIAAWIMVVIGLFGIFGSGGGGDMMGPFAVILIALKLAAIGSVFTGLLLVASVQTARAHIHTAEMTWEMLEMARKVEARAGLGTPPPSYVQSSAAPPLKDLPRQGGSATSEKIDWAFLKEGPISVSSVCARNGADHDLFVFAGGKVRTLVGTAVMEFASREGAIEFLNQA